MNLLLILFTGLISGFLNTVAGGGSLFTIPILIFLGLPSAIANGTNRIALMVQNIVAICNFKSKGFFDYRLGLTLAIPATIGAIIGAKIAISLSDELFNKILATIMIGILILIIWQPQKKSSEIHSLKGAKKFVAIIVFLFIGIYGGLIQAGVGFIIIASLTLITGFSLTKINSIKVLVVALYMLSSLIVFIVNNKIDWTFGIILAIGNSIGAYLGSNFAVNKGDKWIRIVVIVSVILMSLKLFGVIDI
ncbi:sulfite exporter TauE/SafE family protein [Clostridiisalibacter paucivorans]|uniref:sulfite exporter TauE/SafE family protein n=1 Tax=Clostridiisalibacter paucivorans TaxID=408753 RepID=UPI00047D5696|nr:sulfite exporter TauE/SafE family protein [Clostridiisalibacter paucivorans]